MIRFKIFFSNLFVLLHVKITKYIFYKYFIIEFHEIKQLLNI